jgi:hypothetical protein
MIRICELCIKIYEPEEINNVRVLKTFDGFTVDLRLQQFRKVDFELEFENIEFIDFISPLGQKLLKRMHASVIN